MTRKDALVIVIGLAWLWCATILIANVVLHGQEPPIIAPKGYSSNGEVFLGWMKYAAHVQIRFLNGGHTTYGREQMKDITRELEAGLKCVQGKK